MDFAGAVVGNELSEPFTGTVAFDAQSASAKGLPDNAKKVLAAGTPVTVPVTFTNNGVAPEDVFLDPRLNTSASLTLASLPPTTGTVALPLVTFFPSWLVPTETSAISVAQTSSLPAMFDVSPFAGDPDISSSPPWSGPLCSTSAPRPTPRRAVPFRPAAGARVRPSAGRTRSAARRRARPRWR